MHSYETLAILVLALSTASPAFSAPVWESQQQARADIDVDPPAEGGFDFGGLLKTVGINAALGAGTTALEHFLGGNSTRRDTDLTPAVLRFDGVPITVSNNSDSNTPSTTPSQIFVDGRPVSLNQRAPGVASDFLDGLKSVNIPSSIGNGLLAGAAGALGTYGADEFFNHSRREPEPLNLSGIGKGIGGLVASLAASQGIEDLFGSNNTRREPQTPSGSKALNDGLDFEDILSILVRRLADLD